MPDDAQMWDARFRAEGHAYGVEPSLYLKEHRPMLLRGQRALVPADGGGRNGVWLAEQGLDVTSVDISTEGLARGRELAAARGAPVRFVHADLFAWAWPEAACDWIVSVYFHMPRPIRPRLHAAMLRALKPGGHLLIEGFHREQMARQSGGPRDETMLLDETELRADFASAEIRELRKELVHLDESRLHRGPGVLVRMLVRRHVQRL